MRRCYLVKFHVHVRYGPNVLQKPRRCAKGNAITQRFKAMLQFFYKRSGVTLATHYESI